MTEEERIKRVERIGFGCGKKTQLCIECGAEYQAFHVVVGQGDIDRSFGYCDGCYAKKFEEQEKQEAAQRAQEAMVKRREARGRTGIPLRFMNEDFSTFKRGINKSLDSAFKECWKYAEEFPPNVPRGYRSLYIYGLWGIGKSHISCAISHRILDRWDGVNKLPVIRWVSEPDLFQRIQASYNYTYEEKQILPNADDILKELSYADLLILDDVGKEERQDPRFVQRTLFTIINSRYDRDVPMIITANLDPSGLMRHLGGRDNKASFDRLMEMCQGHSVKMDGESYRNRKAKEVNDGH